MGTKAIANEQNLDVQTVVRNFNKDNGDYTVEAVLTKFTATEKPAIVKKVQVSATGKSVELAQTNALTLAVELMGFDAKH